MNAAEFRASLEADGYTVSEVAWGAGVVNDTHTHAFDAKLMCIEGSVAISCGDEERACSTGDWMTMSAGVPHKEVVGPEGVKLLVGRKQA